MLIFCCKHVHPNFRYFIDAKIYKYTISVDGCKVLTPNNHSGCELDIKSSGAKVSTGSSRSTTCLWHSVNNHTGCSMEFSSPLVNKWHYARIVTTNATYTYSILLSIKIESKYIQTHTIDCRYMYMERLL